MRYIISPRSRPKTGDTRIRKGFLYFPKIIEIEIRWWEYAEWEETYFETNWMEGRWFGEWKVTQWMNTAKG